MSTKKFYTVTIESYNTKGKPEEGFYNNITAVVGGKEIVGVFRELHSALETYAFVCDDIDGNDQYGATKTIVSVFESYDYKIGDIKKVEERLGHDADYFTEVGGKIDYDGYICEILTSDFERLTLFENVCAQTEFEKPIYLKEDYIE